MKHTLPCLVIVFFALAAIRAQPVTDDAAVAATAPPPPPPLPPAEAICFMIINNHVKYLSKYSNVSVDTCERFKIALRLVLEAQVDKAVRLLGGAISQRENRTTTETVTCNISVFGRIVPIALIPDNEACGALNFYVVASAEALAHEFLEAERRILDLPYDEAEAEAKGQVSGRRQQTSLTPHVSCEFGPYGVSIQHWTKSDCDDARTVYTRCLTKHQPSTRGTLFKCFTDAAAFIETDVA